MLSTPCLRVACFLTLVTALAAQVQVPTGFADEILVSGLSNPTGMAILPDGRILIIEQAGGVKVYANGASGTVGQIPNVSAGGNMGLLGVAGDPQWPARPYVYFYWTYDTPRTKRLAMYTMTGDVNDPSSTNLGLGARYDIITDIPDATGIHNGGSLRFAPDGTLFLSIGEDFNPCLAQPIDDMLGVILRLDVSSLPLAGQGPPPKAALVPSGNPFSGPNDNARLVWANGLRNPFRFNVDPTTGDLFVGDVGAESYDEIHQISQGGENLGWPWFQGPLPFTTCPGGMPASVNVPIVSHAHGPSSTTILSFPLYRNRPGGQFNYGPAYEGDYFYAEYFSGWIRRVTWDGSAWVPAAPVPGQPTPTEWATGLNNMADSELGPDGAIYYVKRWPAASLRRITSSAPVLEKVSGDAQVGNAGNVLHDPLVVRMTDPAGAPLAGQAVTFSVVSGGASVPSQPVMTDANGEAQVFVDMLASPATDPVIEASISGARSVMFSATWRGLSVVYVPIANLLTITLTHSETSSPVSVFTDSPGLPPFTTPYGSIVTSVLNPLPSLGGFDGLGLVWPALPGVETGATQPVWTQGFTNLPMFGGLTLTLQGYAVDNSRFPGIDAILVSNPVTLTLN